MGTISTCRETYNNYKHADDGNSKVLVNKVQ